MCDPLKLGGDWRIVDDSDCSVYGQDDGGRCRDMM